MIFTLHFWVSLSFKRVKYLVSTCKPLALLEVSAEAMTKFNISWKKSFSFNVYRNVIKLLLHSKQTKTKTSGSLDAIPTFPSAVLVLFAIPFTSLCLSPMPNAWDEGRNNEYNWSLEIMNIQLRICNRDTAQLKRPKEKYQFAFRSIKPKLRI